MADSGNQAEFAFNLFSDLAPVLALFGDEFARQFASESFTWVDHLILAMVPLGILTTINGAIRVQEHKFVKSFIGRSRENRALTEIELMSSTSKEVCELFNGDSIVRVMGKPKLAQILVFPEEYEKLRREYEIYDRESCDPKASPKSVDDKSCGIHSLRTAISTADGKVPLMRCVEYQSHGYKAILKAIEWIEKIFGLFKSKRKPQQMQVDFERLGPPNLQLGLSSDQFEESRFKKRHETVMAAVVAVILQAALISIATVTVFHDRTRRAIAFEPENYGYPCYVIGTILLCIGVGICARAVERHTTEYDWQVLEEKERNPLRNDGEEDIPIQSTATKITPSVDDYPRLFWLQKKQEVSDQAFDGYTILAGSKTHIITSSRRDDTKGIKAINHTKQPQTDEKALGDNGWKWLTICAAGVAGLGFVTQFMGLRGLAYPCSIAQLIAILLMAFIRALIRRRLGYLPAHCGAFTNFEMDSFATCLVYSRDFRVYHGSRWPKRLFLHEMNTRKVLRWNVRTAVNANHLQFHFKKYQDVVKNHWTKLGPKIDESGNSTPGKAPKLQQANEGGKIIPEYEVSCRQLIRVRESVGNICSDGCNWQSPASSGGLSLASAIETFMNAFFPATFSEKTPSRPGKRMENLRWAVETVGLDSLEQANERDDYVLIPVDWIKKNGRWEVDIRRLEAVLSLWMATIEARSKDAGEDEISPGRTRTSSASFSGPVDLRRTKGRYRFCRILGDDLVGVNGILKRDLSWWVDGLIAEQSDDPVEENEACTFSNTRDPVADGTPNTANWRRSKARKGADLIIGFNGSKTEFDPRCETIRTNVRELAVSDTGLLPTILAQHLFTSFMWTIVDHLSKDCLIQNIAKTSQEVVEIEGRHTADTLKSRGTWAHLTLRHRGLTKLVREIEKNGLGKYLDILLCMIPALSSRELLPNHEVLKLLPPICYPQGWVATAQCYNSLLGTSIRTTNPAEMLGYSIIIAAMDFLHFVCEPYDDLVEPQKALKVEIQTLVESLVSVRFRPILTKLAPLYTIQHRRKHFEKIFGRYTSLSDSNQPFYSGDSRVLSESEVGAQSSTDLLIPDFYMTNLGLSKHFKDLYTILMLETADPPREVSYPLKVSLERSLEHAAQAARDVKSLDVFGWSPFHYVALLKDYDSFWIVRELWKRHDIPKFHQTLDRFERTPIHVAVAAGSDQILQYTIEYLEDLDSEDRENVLNASGLDQATILHLATKNGLYDRVKDILKMGRAQSVTRVDLWGREAIHLAARHGHHDIASRLLQEGAQPYHIDKIGMSPLEYLIHGDVGLREVQASDNPKDMQVDQVEDGTPIPEGKDHVEPSETSDSLVIRKRKIFVEFAMKNIDYHDRSGKTFLHHAIQSTDIKTVENLMNKGYKVNQSDSKGSSALHLAVGAGRENLALFMLRNSGTFSVDPSAVDKQGETALMFAVREGYLDLAKRLISGVYFGNPDTKPSQSEVEDQRSPQDTQNEGCDPRTQNLEGRIALQIAISEGYHEIVRYLLKLPKLQDEPQEFSGESLLVTACKQALPTDCVLAIIEAWPTSINDADQRYHQTPLSWACEGGSEEIVKLLLDMDKVDVNKQAQGWRNYSPLHFAARNNNASIVQMLLNHTDIKTELKTAGDSTATDLAIQSSHAPVVEAFLVHRKVDAQARLQHLKRIAGDSDEALHGIIRNIFVSLPDKIIHDSDLLELLELTKTLQCTEPYLKIVERALTRESTWKDVKPKPMHVAARLGSLELIEKLCGRGVQLTDLDEDGWTCLEYADTYRSEPLGSQVRQFIQGKIPEDHRRKDQITPDLLDLTILHGDWMSCNGTSSPGIWNVRVLGPAEETKTSVRTSRCVPPLTSSREYFYYEVKILADSRRKELAIGFCDKRFDRTKLPGWRNISFGYHGDNGNLYINNGGEGLEPTSDFGSQGEFGAGDTVGIGLNLKTGEGLVTLNGKKRDVGDAFQDAKFIGRKMYPCIGFDTTEDGVGLHFEINLGLSLTTHRFMYQGPYE